MYGENLSVVLFPGLNGEIVQTDVEEFDGAVAGSDKTLILVGFGPGEVVEGVLGVKP